MKKTGKFLYRVTALILAMCMMAVPAAADDTDSLEAENDQLEDQVAEEESRLAEIQDTISDLESYIEELDNEIARIEEVIADYETQKEEKQSEIDDLNAQIDELENGIEELEADIETEYEYMSLRIQFMYENVGDSYIDAIFSSETFSEAVQKTMYFLEIARYDRQQMQKIQEMVDESEQLQEEMEAQVAVLEEKIEEIETLETEQEAQQAALDTVRAAQQAELEEVTQEAYDAEELINYLQSKIAENQSQIDAIIAEYQRQQEEEAARIAAEEEAARIAAEEAAASDGTDDGSEETDETSDTSSSGSSSSGTTSSSGSSSYIWPLPSTYKTITSPFGDRSNDPDLANMPSAWYHYGIDIYAPSGTPIYAVMDGVVVLSEYWSSVGNVVIVYLASGLYMEVHHMSSAAVSVGTTVSQGQVVGYVGSTGSLATGAHLHIGISTGLTTGYVNPLNYLPY